MQVLPDMVRKLASRTSSSFGLKINTLNGEQDEITLKSLIDSLKEKYKDAVVRREQTVEEIEEREEYL